MYTSQSRQDRERERITEGEVMTEIVCLYISILFGIILIIRNNLHNWFTQVTQI